LYSSLEAGKFKMKVLEDKVSDLVRRLLSSLHNLTRQKEHREKVLWGLFYKDANLIHKNSNFMTYYLAKYLPPNIISLGIRIPTQESGGDINV
jgi:hypothetical protein